MNCPLCQHERSRVIRTTYGADIRRVRCCDGCGHRWVTVEVEEATVRRAREIQAQVKAIAETVI